MWNLDSKDEHFWRNIITHAVLIIGTVIIIVMLMPKDKENNYSYEVGKPWMYSSLIAKFDFPIYKDEAAFQRDKDSVMSQYEPYFDYDETVATTNVDKFLETYKDGLPDLPKSFIYTVADKLKELYSQGIMDPMNYAQLADDTLRKIRVISGKEATSRSLRGIISTKTAYQLLYQDEAIGAQAATLRKCNLNEYIEPNLLYDQEKSEQSKREFAASVPTASGVVLSGQKIIDRGDIVTQREYRILESLKKETEKRKGTTTDYNISTAGLALYVLILLLILTRYLMTERYEYMSDRNTMLMIYSLIISFDVVVSLMVSHMYVNIYVLPFAMVPLLLNVFTDRRTAFLVNVVMVLICATAVRDQFEFIAVETVAGFAAVYTFEEYMERRQIFTTAAVVMIMSMITYFALELIKTGDINLVNTNAFIYIGISGLLLLFADPAMYILEKMFGQVSNVRLVELAESTKPLQQRLSEEASGTYNHSIQVSILAVDVAKKIGGRKQLLRTAALYHDIGKLQEPGYFTENHARGGVNPLNNLEPQAAAKIIKDHVSYGVTLAEQNNLPKIIIEFIKTHHGTTPAGPFLTQYKNQHPDEDVNPAPFMYDGPNPTTKEQGILMIVDSVQAASRSLDDFREETLKNFVAKIVDGKVSGGYLKDCPLTFRDIEVIKQTLVQKIMAMNHTRISYPEESKEVKAAEAKKKAEAAEEEARAAVEEAKAAKEAAETAEKEAEEESKEENKEESSEA